MNNTIKTLIFLFAACTLHAQGLVNQTDISTSSGCISTPIDITMSYEDVFVAPPTPVISDTDGDGLNDDTEGTDDLDGDGTPNFLDLDSDGDTVPDGADLCYFHGGLPPTGCPSSITDRNVFWVHGYQGNSHSLRMPGEDTENRFKVKSRYPDYNASQTSLEACADQLRDDINAVLNGSVNTERNFIITHSMGGLVTRVMGNIQNPAGRPAFDGVITFGTPHLGAAVANTLQSSSDEIHQYLTKTCKDLAAGPATEEISNTGVVGRLAVTFGLAGGVIEQACDAGVGIGFPLVTSFLSTGLEGQLTTQAASALPDMPTSNKAAFYGVEDDTDETLTPRFMGAVMHSANGFPLYGASAADGLGLTMVNNELNTYVSRATYWDNQHVPWWLWITCPQCAVAEEIRYQHLADSWQKGVDWFPTLNPTWKDLIGALDIQLVQTGCRCDYYAYGNLTGSQTYPGITDCESLESGDFTSSVDCQPLYELSSATRPSDAFILQESAMMMPGANYEPREMPGSNHLQMRNDSEMGKAVDAIFLQGLGKEYFKTKERK